MKAIALIGPTAVGKTAHSFALAEALGAEIISADSRQVYRWMDVGTDKASAEQRRQIPHHLIDVADPDEVFTVSDFVRLAQGAGERIVARGRVPLLVGGTPFYYRAFETGGPRCDLGADENFRRSLQPFGDEELYARLAAADPLRAEKIAPKDRFRVVRALEIMALTGQKASDFALQPALPRHRVLYLGLTKDREVLKRRIARRVREQFEGGYPEEVAALLQRGYSPELPSMRGFGYRELVLYHRGKMTYEQALESDVIATCQFAKRQRTWFKKFDALWFDLDRISESSVRSQMIDAARSFLES